MVQHTSVTIDYYADECFVGVEDYVGEIPAEMSVTFFSNNYWLIRIKGA